MKRRPTTLVAVLAALAAGGWVAAAELADAPTPSPAEARAATPAEAPYREVSRPAGVKPVGAMLVIHGGGWRGGDPAMVAGARKHARRFAAQGWLVWNIDYRSGSYAFGDVLRSYRGLAGRARRARIPICAFGSSAGGHLALLLGSRRHLDCVISQAGPTDLTRLPRWAHRLARAAFGDKLWESSPLRYARERPQALSRTTMLLGHRRGDTIVPIRPVRAFAAALPRRVRLHELSDGRVPFVHGRARASDLELLYAAERRLLRRTAASPRRR